MNENNGKGDWSEIKEIIKRRFSKLSDDSIESMKGNLDLLGEKIQKAYGYAKEQADKEYASFKASLHSATAPDSNADSGPSQKKKGSVV